MAEMGQPRTVNRWTVHPTHSKAGRVTTWVLTGLLAVAFVAASIPKLLNTANERQMFATWGYPNWFMYAVGAFELLIGILILIPRARFWAASLLVIEMMGAVYTHVQAEQYSVLIMPIVPLVMASWLAVLERPPALGGEPYRIREVLPRGD